MVASKWIAAVSISTLGAQSLPPLLNWSKWSPADMYAVCQQVLKLTVLSGPILSIIDAPFGRFALPSSIFSLPGRLAFALMELPVLFAFLLAISNARPLSHDSTLADKGLRSLLTPDIAHLRQLPAANLVLGLLFFIHYLYRAIIQPARSPPRSSSHVSVFFSASLFSLCNGFTMGTWLGGTSPSLLIPTSLLSKSAIAHGKTPVRKSLGWLAGVLPRSSAAPTGVSSSPVLPVAHAGLLPAGYATLIKPLFLLGVLGWIVGFALNVYHDEVLLNLRKGNNQGKNKNNNGTSATQQQYYIPHGGLYKYISYPNYFTEWIEWTSFAVAALSQTSLSSTSSGGPPLSHVGRLAILLTTPPVLFVLAEICTMLPRAVHGHQWYHTKFGVQGQGGEYPQDRKAVLPFLL